MSNSTHPLVTVVTPCYNSADTIERTIESVFAQTYPNIEYIVMDGASTDGTADIARRYEPRLKVISEPDSGQSEAINKGWRMAQGDILAWLNADDQYFPDTVETAVNYLIAHPEAGWVYGYPVSIDKEGRAFPVRPYRPTPRPWSRAHLIYHECYIHQPSVFLRRQVIEEFGYIREDLHYCMDWEYWIRIGEQYPGHPVTAIRASVIRARDVKTERGGIPRLREIEAMTAQYGGKDLPTANHHQWTVASLEALARSIRRGHWKAAKESLSMLGRYPKTLPRGAGKAIMRNLVPDALERKLRQALLRPSDADP